MTIRAQKAAIRSAVIKRVLRIDRAERIRQEANLRAKFSTLSGLVQAETVLLYASALSGEVSTVELLRTILDQGKRLVLPRVERSEKRLRLFRIGSIEVDLVPGVWSIPEPRSGLREIAPEEIDWCLVPGVAFDSRGYRIGRGGGYYDRLIPRLKSQTSLWSVCYDEQWVETVPIEPHDRRLSGIVSPSKFVVCRDH